MSKFIKNRGRAMARVIDALATFGVDMTTFNLPSSHPRGDAILQAYQLDKLADHINAQGQCKRCQGEVEDTAEITSADYSEWTVAELAELTEARGLIVEGTGAKGNIVKADYITALEGVNDGTSAEADTRPDQFN